MLPNRLVHRYRPEVLRRLAELAVFPKPTTDPILVRDYLKALYTVEVRHLRIEQQRLERAGADRTSRKPYRDRVIELRDRYDILSLPVELWTE